MFQDAGGQGVGFLLGSLCVNVALTSEACYKGLPRTQNGEVVTFRGTNGTSGQVCHVMSEFWGTRLPAPVCIGYVEHLLHLQVGHACIGSLRSTWVNRPKTGCLLQDNPMKRHHTLRCQSTSIVIHETRAVVSATKAQFSLLLQSVHYSGLLKR